MMVTTQIIARHTHTHTHKIQVQRCWFSGNLSQLNEYKSAKAHTQKTIVYAVILLPKENLLIYYDCKNKCVYCLIQDSSSYIYERMKIDNYLEKLKFSTIVSIVLLRLLYLLLVVFVV